jgi:hypothetical protein
MRHNVYVKIEYDDIFIYEDVTYKEHLISFIHEIINNTFIKQCGHNIDDVYKNIKIELIIHYNSLILTVDLNLNKIHI